MRKDSPPLADKEEIAREDLCDKPLIFPDQEDSKATATGWIWRELTELDVVATYNLLFNASLFVEEGMGYAIGLDKIINTSGGSKLCFRPLSPQRSAGMHII